MIPLRAKRSQIYSEFSPEEQERYFGLKEKKVTSHIDTLYYFVKIYGDWKGNISPHMKALIDELTTLKVEKKAEYSKQIFFHDLSVEAGSFSVYEFRLSFPDMYDIFIASHLMNDDTPRIVVQLRTASLIGFGPYEAVRDSLEHVINILAAYELQVGDVDINRVDYAYHTNLIQNPMEYFNDKNLCKSLSSSLRKYMKVGTVRDTITLETLSLGNRASNNIFFRCYDKTCEVIQKGYKSFFIEKWLEDELISEYDAFVLMYAYMYNSYVAGIHVGRMEWYIKYGHDEERKERFRELIEKYRIKSDDNKTLKKELDGSYGIDKKDEKEINAVMPKVTLILNIEFQTKRKFYTEIFKTLDSVKWEIEPHPDLRKVYAVIAARSVVQKYLTSETVFWNKHSNGKKLFDKDGNKIPADWWKRIQSCEIDSEADFGPLVRRRDLGADIEKAANQARAKIAHFVNLEKRSTDIRTFHEDVSDMLSYFNDNDFYGFVDAGGNPLTLSNTGYSEIQYRKSRQDRGVIKSMTEKARKNTKENEEKENAENEKLDRN